MNHGRTQIRNAVAALLKGNTTAGQNVFEARVYALDDPKLPALLVYSNDEVVVEQSISRPRTQTRQLSLTIEGYARANSNVDTATDSLAKEIETLVAADPTLGGLVKDAALSTTETQLSSEGEKPVAVVTITYVVTYNTKENAPDVLV